MHKQSKYYYYVELGAVETEITSHVRLSELRNRLGKLFSSHFVILALRSQLDRTFSGKPLTGQLPV